MITNSINKKVLIGLTCQKPLRRWGQHISQLRKNKHPNPHLQSSFNKYGESIFTFEVLDTAKNKEELSQKEKNWISFYLSDYEKFGYNKVSGGMLGSSHNEETRAKMSKIQKEYFSTPEGKARLAKMAEKKKGHTPWNKGTLGVMKAWNKGVARTEEQKRHHSKVMKGKKYPNRKKRLTSPGNVKAVLCHQNGKVYISSAEAAKELNLASRNIRQVAQGVKKTHKGYTFSFIMENI